MATRMVALLRGINVGRSKRVAMAELRSLLSGLGYAGVSTHLQSGNAVFSCPSEAARTAASDIEAAILGQLGVDCRVIVRTGEELRAAIDADPLGNVAIDPSRHLLGFLDGDPGPAVATTIGAIDVAPDQIRLIGRQIYLWCPEGVLASPLAKLGWERSLGTAVTVRNWNTVTRLDALVGA